MIRFSESSKPTCRDACILRESLSWWWVDVAFIASCEIVELLAVDGSVTYSTPVGIGMALRHFFDGLK